MTKVDTFIEKVNSQKPNNVEDSAAYNSEWAKIKATLPEDQKAAAESKVRAVLPL